jgi:hypothetical protein
VTSSTPDGVSAEAGGDEPPAADAVRADPALQEQPDPLTRGGISPTAARWISVGLVLVLNLYPLILVLTRTWLPGDVLIAYWVENIAVGVWSLVRITTACGQVASGVQRMSLRINGRAVDHTSWRRWALGGFFVLHFGIFTVVHGVFTVVIALWAGVGASLSTWVGMFVLALISHGVSTAIYWFYLGERDTTSAPAAMMAPYGRIVILHVVVIVSFWFLIASFNGRAAGGLWASDSRLDYHLLPAVLLIVLRTVIEVVAHLRQHRGLASVQS